MQTVQRLYARWRNPEMEILFFKRAGAFGEPARKLSHGGAFMRRKATLREAREHKVNRISFIIRTNAAIAMQYCRRHKQRRET